MQVKVVNWFVHAAAALISVQMDADAARGYICMYSIDCGSFFILCIVQISYIVARV